MDHPEHIPEAELNADNFAQQVAINPAAAYQRFQELQAQVEALRAAHETPSSTSPSEPPPPPPQPAMDPNIVAMIAQIVATTIQSQVPAPVAATTATPRLSEKLPDIDEFDGDREKLEGWEYRLVQRMNVNHDRYPTDSAKISYAESRLTIGKKAFNLMMPYRHDGICTLTSFAEYRAALRRCCGNPFEAEDVRTYLRDTLKQGTMTFAEYYQLFCQKKDRSCMEEASLIDCLKRNVNYATQLATFSWRTINGKRPCTFQEWVQAFTDTDEELQQLKHRQPRSTTAAVGPTNKPRNPPASGTTPVVPRVSTVVPVAAVTPTAVVSVGEPMDLSSAQAAVKNRKLTKPGVKDICSKFNLCYYCKLQYPGKNASNCPNKKITSLRAVDMDDTASIDGGVPSSGKA